MDGKVKLNVVTLSYVLNQRAKMAVLTVASHFPDDIFRINNFFSGIGQGSIRSNTSNTIVIGTPDLNRLVITGNGLQYDPMQLDPWIGGTITGIALWDRTFDKKIAEISGISISLTDFGQRLGAAIYGPFGLVSFLFGGNDVIEGGANNDSFYAYDGDDTVRGGAGNDDIAPGKGNDVVDGGDGFDFVSYWDYEAPEGETRGVWIWLSDGSVRDPWGGTDQLIAIEGVEGTDYNDRLDGNGGVNELYGLAGNDTLSGLGGDDFIAGGKGADHINGGEGFDIVSYAEYVGTAALTINLQFGGAADPWGDSDTVFNVEGVRGTGNGDSIMGSILDNFFQGLGGNDTIDGGGGLDAVSYAADKGRGGLSGVSVDLAAGTARDGLGGTDTLINIESVYGTDFDDTLGGSNLDNTLSGNGGADRLSALAGSDWLYGGNGNDTLTAGAGRDGFVFNTKANSRTNVDTITDFRAVDDTIFLDRAVFSGARKGLLAASAFTVGKKAADSGDRIIYDKGTGALYYDSDGTGRAAQVKFAIVSKNLKLTNYDFVIY